MNGCKSCKHLVSESSELFKAGVLFCKLSGMKVYSNLDMAGRFCEKWEGKDGEKRPYE